MAHTAFPEDHVTDLEGWIDAMDTKLPPLKNFILPSGGLAAAQFHVARTVCRRTERDLVSLLEEEQINPIAFTYVNRLSDYLFTLARVCALIEGKPETIYKKARAKKEIKEEA